MGDRHGGGNGLADAGESRVSAERDVAGRTGNRSASRIGGPGLGGSSGA